MSDCTCKSVWNSGSKHGLHRSQGYTEGFLKVHGMILEKSLESTGFHLLLYFFNEGTTGVPKPNSGVHSCSQTEEGSTVVLRPKRGP